MRVAAMALAAATLALGACVNDGISTPPGAAPGVPRQLEVYYHARAVHLSWELPSQWNGEFFRVYGKRSSDAAYFLIAEMTNCAGGVCRYSDVNVTPGVTYLYYVASVRPASGLETPTANSVQVRVPLVLPPPVPGGASVVALDNANYVRWNANARAAGDFSHYRVWLHTQGGHHLLGETDSEGFLDLLARNGSTYSYSVTSMDAQGHESQRSAAASGTPRPDFHTEWLFDFFDVPASSGFRFQNDGESNPIVSGSSPARHFRLEVDDSGWWLVPGPNTTVHPSGFATTVLKCGVAADQGCVSLDVAPTSGYVAQDLGLAPQTTYVLRVRGDDNQNHYAAIRIQHLGFDGTGRALMIFDWAYQLQPGNPNLSPQGASAR